MQITRPAAGLLRHGLVPFTAVLAVVALVGCATIVNSTTQKVNINSTPVGATVTVDGASYGTTPLVANLARKSSHTVVISMPGYVPAQLNLDHTVSGWFFGNILFGGIIGIVVDAVDGAMYKLTPTQLRATLQRSGTRISDAGGGLYIATVLVPDPTWQKIGSLTRAGAS